MKKRSKGDCCNRRFPPFKKERPTTQLLSPPLPLHIFILNGNNDELWGAL
jgi:hypothetical protein